MICYAAGLVEPAMQAGIAVPEDIESPDPAAFPHWTVYCNAQLGSPMPNATSHWTNAKLIAAIPADRICHVTPADLLSWGWQG